MRVVLSEEHHGAAKPWDRGQRRSPSLKVPLEGYPWHLIPGACATELALARRVDTYGTGLRGLTRHVVRHFASVLEAIPAYAS